MATSPPSSSRPTGRAETGRTQTARAVAVTVAAAGLVIGVLAALPGHARGVPATSIPSHSTTTTTTRNGHPTTTTTTPASSGIKVAVLAPAGSPDAAIVRHKLTVAHDTLVTEAPIPLSWVSSLSGPEVEYPPGLSGSAGRVAAALGQKPSAISPEQPGSSNGADVVEVFVPAS